MWREKARGAAPRVLAALSALVLTAVAFVYTPIVFTTSTQGSSASIRLWLLLPMVILAAVSTWMLVIGRQNLVVRMAINFSSGFNLIWIFSFIGPPVVVASVLAAGLATVPVPRQQLPTLFGVAIGGLALGLLVLILTQPPGERIFG
jgi:hypothetical protein